MLIFYDIGNGVLLIIMLFFWCEKTIMWFDRLYAVSVFEVLSGINETHLCRGGNVHLAMHVFPCLFV